MENTEVAAAAAIIPEAARKKRRVAAYCRVSTDNESQKSSAKNQIMIYKEKIRQNPNWTLAGIYADPEYSGTNANRPQFKRLLRDVEKGKIDYIITKSLSRFARNTLLTIQTLRRFKELGVGVLFEKEGIDTATPYSEIILTIFAAFAQEESRNTSERVKKGLQMRARNGKVNWVRVYGYDKDYVIREEEAAVIRRIFDEYTGGKYQKEIAEGLNADGIPSPFGSVWNPSRITEILRREKYCGDVVTNKTFTENHLTHKAVRNRGEVKQIHLKDHHTPIVTREQFEAAQKRRRVAISKKHLFCPFCGEQLVGYRGKGWQCKCGKFYIPTKKIREAMAAAGDEDKIAECHFGLHRKLPECTMTAIYRDGTVRTVPTGFNRMWASLSMMRKKERAASSSPAPAFS